MKNNRYSLVVIGLIMLVFYALGVIWSYNYTGVINDHTFMVLDKSDFTDINDQNNTLENRHLEPLESKVKTFELTFSSEMMEGLFVDAPYAYIMIEKPDCQYLEVFVNGRLIGTVGHEDMNSNLWSTPHYVKFNDHLIEEKNSLTLIMHSDYMNGIAGDVRLLNEDDFKAVYDYTEGMEIVYLTAIILSLFTAFILILIVLALRKHLYSIWSYVYFLICIAAFGIAMLDYVNFEYTYISYFTFKKIVIISYHVAITFIGLGTAQLLNSKVKINIGILGLIGAIYTAYISSDMLEFRTHYEALTYFLIFAIVQMVLTLLVRWKRSPLASGALLLGFILGGFTAIETSLVVFGVVDEHVLIGLPIIVINVVLIIMYIFYVDLVLMTGNQSEKYMSDSQVDVTSYMQGTFKINKKLQVNGQYSPTCDHIFNQLLVGKNLPELMAWSEEDLAFYKDVLENIFNKKKEFKDGFLELLPKEAHLVDRIYHMDYRLTSHPLELNVTLSDITKTRKLEAQLDSKDEHFRFIINALKSKKEIAQLISIVNDFMSRLKIEGNQDKLFQEMHMIKGNLGQFGFVEFENKVHELESIWKNDFDIDLILTELESSFNASLEVLYQYVPESYFDIDKYTKVLKEDLGHLEDLSKRHLDETHVITEHVQRLRRVNLIGELKQFEGYTLKLADERQKLLHPLEFTGDEVYVLPDKLKSLINMMIALYRNAVIHGLETTEDRMYHGKDLYSKITTRVKKEENTIIVSIKDDGKGITVDQIKTIAEEKGIAIDEAWTEEEIINLIFNHKFSTAEQVDILSGRGVGLSGLKTEVEKLKGTLTVETVEREYTVFIIRLPIETII